MCPYKSNYKFDKPRKGGDSQRLAFLEFLLEPKKVHLKAKGAKLFKVFLKTLRESSDNLIKGMPKILLIYNSNQFPIGEKGPKEELEKFQIKMMMR